MDEDDDESEGEESLDHIKSDAVPPIESLLQSDQQLDARLSSASVPTKKKKKRKGLSFNSSQKKQNSCSKNLQNLPAYLSDFSWIENTEGNMELI